MGSTKSSAKYPATSDEMKAALNAALEAGNLEPIMGTLGEMTHAHRMKRVDQETGLGRESLYKSMRAGASPEFNTMLRVLRAPRFHGGRLWASASRYTPSPGNIQASEREDPSSFNEQPPPGFYEQWMTSDFTRSSR